MCIRDRFNVAVVSNFILEVEYQSSPDFIAVWCGWEYRYAIVLELATKAGLPFALAQ